ncbi:hypothetical protein PG999_011207 [Apiospora kogelbergensis]|uniref:Uncharacterized protein n=1 Tax=Apiospora kogelbergensis TaxID=1337665 RepID=A0AAW0QCA1_9PEZI
MDSRGTADLKQPKVKSQSTLAMKLLSFVHKQRQAVQEDETEPKDASSTSSTTVTDESYRRSLLITVPVGEVPERYFKNSTGSELSPEELMQLSVLVHPALAEQNISLLDALQSGLLIPKGPVTDANLVTPDSGYGPGSDTGSNERPLSEERPASRDGRAKEDLDSEEQFSISPLKGSDDSTPVLPELDFILGADDFDTMLDLVRQSRLVLVADEPAVVPKANADDENAQEEPVDLHGLFPILAPTPEQHFSATMEHEAQPETPRPESPTIPHGMAYQRYTEPDDCPPPPGPPPSRPPPKEPTTPVKFPGRLIDNNISPVASPLAGFVKLRREASAPGSQADNYEQLGNWDGSGFSPQLQPPEIPVRSSSAPRRDLLKIPMPALPPHMQPLTSSSPESPEFEDSQNSVDDLISEARRIASDHS